MDSRPIKPKITLTLLQKRAFAGFYVVTLLFCAADLYLQWQLFGGFDKKVLAAVTFLGVIIVHRFGPAMLEEIREYRAKRSG